MKAWYALYTKPNAEAQVARALMARGFEAFLPLLPARKDGRLAPLFPTYLFVNCDLADIDMDLLQWIPGLRRILTLSGKPAVVPDAAIQIIETGLREIEAAGGLLQHRFKPGDTVVIEEGPLAGLRGIFQGPLGPAERVRILIRFLGETNKAEVPVEALRRVDNASTTASTTASSAAPSAAPSQGHRRGTRGGGRRIHYPD